LAKGETITIGTRKPGPQRGRSRPGLRPRWATHPSPGGQFADERSASSAVKWLQRWRDHGVCAPKPRGGSRSVLEDYGERILALVAEQPDHDEDEEDEEDEHRHEEPPVVREPDE
jgi:hypothetical protein